VGSLCSLFTGSGSFIMNKKIHRGDQIENALFEQFRQYAEIKLYIKRTIIDTEQMMCSAEAVMRTKSHSSDSFSESQVIKKNSLPFISLHLTIN